MIGIAGCSGSGKTTLARELATQLDATLFPLDLYYRDLSQFPLDARSKQLRPSRFAGERTDCGACAGAGGGRAIQRPVYDFKTHSRVAGVFERSRRGVVIVEGILALHYAELLPCTAFPSM